MTNHVHVETRLPRNAKEGLLFLFIISFISVITIAPMIMGLERGFSKETYFDVLKIIPIMWVIVIAAVKLIAGPIVGKLIPKFVRQTDGFNARVLLHIVLTVTVMSLLLTIIGTWVGTKQISTEPFEHYLHVWPRNFGVAFWIELLIAHPVARFAMKTLHATQARKGNGLRP